MMMMLMIQEEIRLSSCLLSAQQILICKLFSVTFDLAFDTAVDVVVAAADDDVE